ncbi:2-oxoglutarate dehydrogenase complex dihydrolipoyllysine-residue succinyltransferase [Candidatus Sumerlaeota bacterium]|nr:2-oxoglutarate dehydrogenase complex dihydrolipoyllysine-residue succinyltransferase [Candidatus Sumerlaeota bacterium]
MVVDIKVPSVGESISEVTIASWYKQDGEFVKKDEPLLEMETDKINTELNAPESGILRHGAKSGDVVAVGAIVGKIAPGAAPAETASQKRSEPAAESKPVAEAKADAQDNARASSVARKVAVEYGVNLGEVEGRGSGGRITKEDVLSHVQAKKSVPAQVATPAAVPVSKPAAPSTPRSLQPAGSREETRERMSTLRKRIAARLVESQHTAAMLTTFNEVDMTAVMELRTRYKDSFAKKHGIGLGFMSFFVKAAIEALRTYPRVNAFIQGDEIVYHHYNDIGVAVGTDKGLVVPVIRNAEALTFAGVEKAIRDFAEKAKNSALTLDDLTGGTFTVSNGGVYGSMMSTPILNPPQSGILGMHNIIKRPIAINDQVVIRPMMYLALSYDHRIIDGKEAVGFLIRIKECIEAPERLLLEI